ncbi:hypothetical protein ACFU7Y_41470 [Kitasatospora sp. NPDC057542]|uniref:hypothetical protein n=1 Tax=Streptomycetaceae TaxID=2062 RepID=UPI001CD00021|nr:hypothetical protein [Streptomyces sp. LS1784]
MDPELTDIATRGATALAGLMVTSAWDRVKPRVAAMFGRRAESISEELDETQAELAATPDGGRESAIQSAQGEWQPKLRRLLANDPAMAAELQAILDEFAPKPTERSNLLHNDLKDVTVSGGIVIQAGTITARDIGS